MADDPQDFYERRYHPSGILAVASHAIGMRYSELGMRPRVATTPSHTPAVSTPNASESNMPQIHYDPNQYRGSNMKNGRPYNRDSQTRVSPPRPAPSAADLEKRIARLEANSPAGREVRAFLAKHPELPASLVKVLQTKPLADVKAIVHAMGASQEAPPSRLPPAEKAALDRAMGLSAPPQTTSSDYTLVLAGPRRGARKAPPSRLPPAEKARLDAQMGLSPSGVGHVYKDDYRLVLGAPVDPRKAG